MLKSASKWLALTYLWQRYKNHLKPFFAFLAVLLLIIFIHAEYLSYAEVSGDKSYVGFSFLFKWFAILLAALIYILFPLRSIKKPGRQKKKNAQNAESLKSGDQKDPFNSIRGKGRLRSKADFILEKESPKP